MAATSETTTTRASPLGLETRRSLGLWAQYAASTLPLWLRHEGGSEEVTPHGAGYWIERTGPLSEDELSALHTLAAPGDSLSLAGSRVMAVAREWTPGSSPSAESPDVSEALAALAPRLLRVFDAAGPILAAWETHVPTAAPPPWFERERAALARFMGGQVARRSRFSLLPTSPDQNGEVWRAFIGNGNKGLLCGGQPAIADALWEDLLHTAAHAAQRIRLEPLMEAYLASPHGQELAAACEETPYAAWLRTIPSVGASAIRDVVRETVIHALVYQGALRTTGGLPALDGYWREIAETSRATLSAPAMADERSGTYTAWVLGACATLQPLLQRYLDEGRELDSDYIQVVFATFQTLHDRWRAASRN